VLDSGSDQIARHWQDFNSWVVLHPEKTFDDYLKERPNAAFEAFIASATASFMQTTGAYAIEGGVAKAKAGAASIRSWFDIAGQSKGRDNDPAQLAADLQRLADRHGIGAVHIAAPELVEVLQQAGDEGQAILSQMPDLAQQLPEAMATGGDVQIPTGELLAAASGSGMEDALVQHLRIDPAAPSLAQAEQTAVGANETAQALSDQTELGAFDAPQQTDLKNRPLDIATGSQRREVGALAKAKELEARYLDNSKVLINAGNATIAKEKLLNYALNPNQSKSRVFKSKLGFDQTNAGDLADQLQRGVTKYPARLHSIDKYGTRFTVDIPVVGPKGEAIVRTGWIFDVESDVPRLATLLVEK
jgi:hypothetical protein